MSSNALEIKQESNVNIFLVFQGSVNLYITDIPVCNSCCLRKDVEFECIGSWSLTFHLLEK